LASLPIHAAGIYGGSDPESISDYAISSYTPTVSMLAGRARHSRPVPAIKAGICLLSQANAPGLPEISGTRDEVNRIAGMLKSYCPSVKTLRLEDKAATQEALINAMSSCSWIHLACHGAQKSDQPLKSGFALADGRLELATIIKSDLKHAEFAFLSACETSTGDVQLSEESVHLAAGMLAIGFRSVVGTMWSIPDRQAPQVAEDLYREMLARRTEVDGVRTLDAEQAAYALHHAIRAMRKRVGDSKFEDWVQYVHFGV
jgi:CHAT domain-containing protein